MGLATDRCSLRDDDSSRKPWRCDSCGLFVYSRDGDGNPSSYFGGEYGGKRYDQVCTLCYQMKDALQNPEFCQDKNYWRAIQNTVDAIKKVRREKYLKGGGEGGVM